MSVEDGAAGYRAAKESAVVFDLTGWTVVGLSGADCVKFLHNFCTNDVKGLARGQGCEAFITNVKARVLGHVLLFADDVRLNTGGEAEGMALTLLTTAGQAERLVAHLDRYVITEDVSIEDATGKTGLLGLVGPSATETLREFQASPPDEPPGPGRFTTRPVTIDGQLWPVRRADVFHARGYFLQLSPERVAAARERLIEAGAVHGSEGAFEALRVEACFPSYGVDMTEEHLAPEVGRPWAISYTKGCYLGQEPIARIDALGHVNRLLCGMKLESSAVPERGAAVVAEGKQIGSVTSAAASYSDGRAVALGYLRTKFATDGTRVAVRTNEGEVDAAVYREPLG